MKTITDYIEESQKFLVKGHTKGQNMSKQQAIKRMKLEDMFITHKTFKNNEYLSYETTDYSGNQIKDEDDCYVLWIQGQHVQKYEMWELDNILKDKKYDDGWTEYTK